MAVLGITEGLSVPIFAFFGPVALDLLTRNTFGPLKVILFTNITLLCCSIIYGYIQVKNNLSKISRLILFVEDDQPGP